MEKFSYEENGYNRKEVNRFIGEVIENTEAIVKRVKTQDAEIKELKKELEHYKNMEGTLKQAIYNAQSASDNIKRLAREESDMIVTEARHNANRIVNEALLRAEKIELDSDNLLRNTRIFKKKLKSIVEQQLDIVEEIEMLELE